MLQHAFIQQITVLATKRSAYGDIIPDPTGSNRKVYCRFRVISKLSIGANREEYQPKSMMATVWFAPDTAIEKGSIFLYESRYWEIIELTEARRMGRTTLEFLKGSAIPHDMIS